MTITDVTEHGTNLMRTKKLLVAFDLQRPERISSDFLVVIVEAAGVKFFGTKSKKPAECGLVVHLGRKVGAADLFARLVDTGNKIDDVDAALRTLEEYIQELQAFRIGNILKAEPDAESGRFKLIKLADAPPSSDAVRLP